MIAEALCFGNVTPAVSRSMYAPRRASISRKFNIGNTLSTDSAGPCDFVSNLTVTGEDPVPSEEVSVPNAEYRKSPDRDRRPRYRSWAHRRGLPSSIRRQTAAKTAQ